PNPSNPVSSTATSPSTRTRIPGFPHAPPTPKAPATRTPPTAPSDPVDDREHYPGRVYIWRLNAQRPPQIRPHLSPAVYTDGMRASDRAYTTLREEIVEGTLEPGAVLGEVEQSARLGISRTPLREALSRLTANGLAAPSRGRGLVVTAVSLDEAPHLFDLRIALETLAARRAAERTAHRPGPTATAGTHSDDDAAPTGGSGLCTLFTDLAAQFDEATTALAAGTDPTAYYTLTEELDAALDTACGNPYLADSLRGLRLHLGRLRRLARNSPTRLAASAQEH